MPRRSPPSMSESHLGFVYGACSGPKCNKRTNLLQCSGCRVVKYCSVEHQKAHRPVHKSSCNLVKKAIADLAEKEAELRAEPGGDITCPPNPWENCVGQFWHWHVTRPYMQARHNLMSASLNIRTGEAVQSALDHCLDMLRLCRGDNMGVRSQVPTLYLRLGRDQDAFDFMKWWMDTDGYDWGDMDLPYLDMEGEDATEDVSEGFGKMLDLSMLVCMTLLKLRLHIDVSMLQMEIKDDPSRNTYEGKMEWIRENGISDVLFARRNIMEMDDYAELEERLEKQVDKLIELTHKHNAYFWPGLLNPDKYADKAPGIYTWGSESETVLAFRYTWYAWAECMPARMVMHKKLEVLPGS